MTDITNRLETQASRSLQYLLLKMQLNRLTQQLQFIIEIDKLKNVLRQTLLIDASRRENSGEHSWHLAMMTMILAEYATEGTDLFRAMKMSLIHDLVEIDAGDTFCYDVQGYENKAERELEAATRIFGLLPEEQAKELRLLWDEFEARVTPTAKFAAALDRIQPFLHNQQTEGGTWKIHNINRSQVMKRMAPVEEGTPELWDFILAEIEDCITKEYLKSS
ncbi:MAG: HD domain-containing protein [Rivularia sp. (in: cyanobacteria)]